MRFRFSDHQRPAWVSPPLERLLSELAVEAADEQAGPESGSDNLWAGLLRDGRNIAAQLRQLTGEKGATTPAEEIDPEEWRLLESAAGVIVLRDNAGIIETQLFESEEELAAAWSAVMADLEPEEPGPATVRPPESDENPT